MRAQLAAMPDLDDPLATVEEMAEDAGWSCMRAAPEELMLSIPGELMDLQASAQWIREARTLQFTCMWDMPVAPARREQVERLVALANARLPLGHFEYWRDAGMVLFRHGLPLPEGRAPDMAQVATLMQRAIAACTQYFPAFQFVVWAGKSAHEALSACLFETAGEA